MTQQDATVMRTLHVTGEVGEAVRLRREELGLTQKEVAAKIGVSRKWYIDLEQGKPTVELYKVLDTFWALNLELQVKAAS
ncbi:helix-turn-helix domain-containing protein [Rothia sp. SD9660Na]|uniref:helix-turn-helix domain-containing protein n=1 Tax=Rothia sp. SD9660Na TaxID=3047030 RepID=UPI0024BBD761|nr:helix-turn-helix domain-containing protein [Rothia sp. SD9660Na]WHS50881.1 helix-turn-helix domain-containing protein [Rothia sp. SD9660Na]